MTTKKPPSPPDHEIKPQDAEEEDEPPRVYRIVKRGSPGDPPRRSFFRGLAGATGLGALADAITSCANSAVSIQTAGGVCTCHVVCQCDSESETESSVHRAVWADGGCQCHTVCSCDTVCSCEQNCSCDTDTGSSSGYSYSYCYWYPD